MRLQHRVSIILSLVVFSIASAQVVPTGNPADFKVKTCLHSVSYAGIWRGHTRLSVDDFLVKASELGYDGVMLVAKQPHVSPFDYDQAARKKLKARIKACVSCDLLKQTCCYLLFIQTFDTREEDLPTIITLIK